MRLLIKKNSNIDSRYDERMKIKVLITGGTIDKTYNELTGELSFTETHIVDMFNRGRSMTDTLSEVLFLKDI